MRPAYVSSTFSCFRLLFTHASLLLPDALLIAITSLLFFGVIYLNDLQSLFTLAEAEFQLLLRDFLSETPRVVQLIVSALIALALNVFVGLTLVAARLEMIQSVLVKKPVSFFVAYQKGRRLLWRLFGVKFLTTLLYVVVGLVFLGIFFRFFGPGPASTAPSFAFFIFLFVALVLFLLLKLLFLFVYPHLLYQKKPIWATLRSTTQYALAHKQHVVFVGLVILACNLAVQVVLSLFSSLAFLTTISGLVGLLVGLILTVWSTLFIFVQYSIPK